jgi:Carboxypeptidase regulatory-like domain
MRRVSSAHIRQEVRRQVAGAVGIALCSLFAVASLGQQPADKDTKPSTSITGRVINRGGEPITGAVVSVATVGGSGPSMSAPVDSGGSFKVTGLGPGLYRVSANVPGYVIDSLPAASDDFPRFYHEGDDVTITLIKGGVITGKVTTAAGEPVVAVSVRAFRIRNEAGKALQSGFPVRERATDDRGTYRVYGLPPGTYVVSAGGSPRIGPIAIGGHDNEAPVYAPASTRDTAAEISVNSGEEANADIQYRADPGHSISGTMAGLPQTQSFSTGSVSLIDARGRSPIASAPVTSIESGFVFFGVPDGEYEVSGSQFLSTQESFGTDAQRVKVAGADITGIKLTLFPLALIEGKVVLEKDPRLNCGKRRETAAHETIVSARRFDPEKKSDGDKVAPADGVPLLLTNAFAEAIPLTTGTFSLRNLRRGSYWIDLQAPAAGWYTKSITIGNATSARSPGVNVPRDGITLKSSDHVTGLTVSLAEGGADLRGHVSKPEGEKLPPGLRVYLAPAERENADNALRFYEGRIDNDGNFAINNLAPGRYWIIARPAPETVRAPRSTRQDSTLRSQVLAEAQTSKKEVVFKPCEQLKDFDLHYTPASPRNQ